MIKLTSGTNFEINPPKVFGVSPSFRRGHVAMDEGHGEMIDALMIQRNRL